MAHYLSASNFIMVSFCRQCEQNYSWIRNNWINNTERIKPLFMRLNLQNEKSGIAWYYTSKHNKPLFRGV